MENKIDESLLETISFINANVNDPNTASALIYLSSLYLMRIERLYKQAEKLGKLPIVGVPDSELLKQSEQMSIVISDMDKLHEKRRYLKSAVVDYKNKNYNKTILLMDEYIRHLLGKRTNFVYDALKRENHCMITHDQFKSVLFEQSQRIHESAKSVNLKVHVGVDFDPKKEYYGGF